MDKPFVFESKIMWSQLDANMHLRHSAYADFAAQARIDLMEHLGFTAATFKQFHIGPILFREELIYLKEVKPNDTIRMTSLLSKLSEDKSRWSFTQEMYRGDNTKVAIIHVDGAWLDLHTRKLALLPQELISSFTKMLTNE
jgi:acyl-CoA thioester hydrolase